MVAHWAAFANRFLRNYTRKYMFKFWKSEKRRRAIVMRENMARRTLIRANPQYGPFRPTDTHECSSDSDEEPTVSVAPAASDVPTAAPGLRYQPAPSIDRALDVLNAPGSTRQEFQSYFRPRNLGPGDLEELSPELWRNSDSIVQELSMICTCKIWQMKRPKVLNKTLTGDGSGASSVPRIAQGKRRHQDHLAVLVDLRVLH